jgi:2-polyprenyl-3-methyl-5-hydroxy-6-metoxy-1,4-benzoquinol methylase
VLDLGCIQHNPENYKSKYWLHKALYEVSKEVKGLDFYEEGVNYLKNKNYDVFIDNAENFDTGEKYDVIVAGDLIEHLENLWGFLESCKKHLHNDGKLLISSPNPWYWRNIAKVFYLGQVSTNPEHTLWMCPTVLGQLVNRHGMKLRKWHYNSRYLRDRVIPLPKGVKHTSFHAVVCNS